MTALHLVTAPQEAEPEDELGALFRREVAAQAELRVIREDQHRARQRYAAKHNLLILPGFDVLRRLFG